MAGAALGTGRPAPTAATPVVVPGTTPWSVSIGRSGLLLQLEPVAAGTTHRRLSQEAVVLTGGHLVGLTRGSLVIPGGAGLRGEFPIPGQAVTRPVLRSDSLTPRTHPELP